MKINVFYMTYVDVRVKNRRFKCRLRDKASFYDIRKIIAKEYDVQVEAVGSGMINNRLLDDEQLLKNIECLAANMDDKAPVIDLEVRSETTEVMLNEETRQRFPSEMTIWTCKRNVAMNMPCEVDNITVFSGEVELGKESDGMRLCEYNNVRIIASGMRYIYVVSPKSKKRRVLVPDCWAISDVEQWMKMEMFLDDRENVLCECDWKVLVDGRRVRRRTLISGIDENCVLVFRKGTDWKPRIRMCRLQLPNGVVICFNVRVTAPMSWIRARLSRKPMAHCMAHMIQFEECENMDDDIGAVMKKVGREPIRIREMPMYEIEVYVHDENSRRYSVMACCIDLVWDLKVRYATERKILSDVYAMTLYAGDNELRDRMTLWESGLHKGAFVRMKRRETWQCNLTIRVDGKGKDSLIDLRCDDTVDAIIERFGPIDAHCVQYRGEPVDRTKRICDWEGFNPIIGLDITTAHADQESHTESSAYSSQYYTCSSEADSPNAPEPVCADPTSSSPLGDPPSSPASAKSDPSDLLDHTYTFLLKCRGMVDRTLRLPIDPAFTVSDTRAALSGHCDGTLTLILHGRILPDNLVLSRVHVDANILVHIADDNVITLQDSSPQLSGSDQT